MVCEVAERGLDALGRGWSSLQSQTSSIHQVHRRSMEDSIHPLIAAG